jgi:hypothetical protein
MKPTDDKELVNAIEKILKPYLWTVNFDIPPTPKILKELEKRGHHNNKYLYKGIKVKPYDKHEREYMPDMGG